MFPADYLDDDDEDSPWLDEIEGHHFDPANLFFFDGIDDDIFFNDDLYDDFYEQDSDFSDVDDDDIDDDDLEVQETKVIRILQDSSSILSQLTFHGEDDGRLPRVRSTEPETYETVYQVLVELDILLRTWKRRCDHAYTAHLKRDDLETDATPEGIDHLDSFADDHDQIVRPKASDVEISENTTKKMFCQSTRMFYNVFRSDEEFLEVLSLVRRSKKYIHNIIFALFIDVFPPPVKQRLPTELWEKIWHQTQRPFKARFEVGLRSSNVGDGQKYRMLEQNRLNEFFGAAGNLHMAILEVLFKKPSIVKTPEMFEIECPLEGSAARKIFFRSVFLNFRSQLSRKFVRLQVLDNIPGIFTPQPVNPAPPSRPSSVDARSMAMADDEDTESVDSFLLHEDNVAGKLRSGAWIVNRISSVKLKDKTGLKDGKHKISYPQAVFPASRIKHICMPENDSSFGFFVTMDDNKGQFWIFDVNTLDIVVQISVELNRMLHSLFHRSENFNVAMCGRKTFYMLQIPDKTSSANPDHILLSRWTLPSETGASASAEPQHERLFIKDATELKFPLPHTISPEAVVRVKMTNLDPLSDEMSMVVNCYDSHASSVIVVDSKSDSVARVVYHSEQRTYMDSVKDGLALLRNSSTIDVLDLKSSRVISSYSFDSLREASDLNLLKHDHVLSKFDASTTRQQFVIFSRNMEFFQLMEYKIGETETTVRLLHRGSAFIHDTNNPSLKLSILSNGILFFAPTTHYKTTAGAVPEFHFLPRSAESLTSLVAVDLRFEQHAVGTPLAYFGKVDGRRLTLNNLQPKFEADRDSLAFTVSGDDGIVVHTSDLEFIKISFSHGSRDVAEREADLLRPECRQVEADKKLRGRVINWKKGFGFIQPDNLDERRTMGNVFFHITSFRDRKIVQVRPGLEVLFSVEFDPLHRNFRALSVKAFHLG